MAKQKDCEHFDLESNNNNNYCYNLLFSNQNVETIIFIQAFCITKIMSLLRDQLIWTSKFLWT